MLSYVEGSLGGGYTATQEYRVLFTVAFQIIPV
jgi:hypothetical protein